MYAWWNVFGLVLWQCGTDAVSSVGNVWVGAGTGVKEFYVGFGRNRFLNESHRQYGSHGFGAKYCMVWVHGRVSLGKAPGIT